MCTHMAGMPATTATGSSVPGTRVLTPKAGSTPGGLAVLSPRPGTGVHAILFSMVTATAASFVQDIAARSMPSGSRSTAGLPAAALKAAMPCDSEGYSWCKNCPSTRVVSVQISLSGPHSVCLEVGGVIMAAKHALGGGEKPWLYAGDMRPLSIGECTTPSNNLGVDADMGLRAMTAPEHGEKSRGR